MNKLIKQYDDTIEWLQSEIDKIKMLKAEQDLMDKMGTREIARKIMAMRPAPDVVKITADEKKMRTFIDDMLDSLSNSPFKLGLSDMAVTQRAIENKRGRYSNLFVKAQKALVERTDLVMTEDDYKFLLGYVDAETEEYNDLIRGEFMGLDIYTSAPKTPEINAVKGTECNK